MTETRVPLDARSSGRGSGWQVAGTQKTVSHDVTFPRSARVYICTAGMTPASWDVGTWDEKWPIHRCIYVYVHMYTHMHMPHRIIRQGPASPGTYVLHTGQAGGRPAQCDKQHMQARDDGEQENQEKLF